MKPSRNKRKPNMLGLKKYHWEVKEPIPKKKSERTYLVASKPPIKQYFEALIAPSGPCKGKHKAMFQVWK
jgi:hypothetical protein